MKKKFLKVIQNTFVAKIDLSLAEKLRLDLADQGFEFSTPQHTIFSAKKQGVVCTLYASGKIIVQGKNKNDFITFYLEPEILKELSFSHPETLVDLTPHIGIDEAGKGDFFGPLCIGGVYADEKGIKKLIEMGVRDSKRMNDTSILAMACEIRSFFPHTLLQIFPKKYNELYQSFKNLNFLLGWCHATAIEELVKTTHCKNVIIDQFAKENVVLHALEKKELSVNLTQRHYGEEDLVVAAASILARASFVEGLEQLGKMIQLTLPKGANSHVIEMGKKIVLKHGKEMLEKLSKLHFKTTNAILDVENTDSKKSDLS